VPVTEAHIQRAESNESFFQSFNLSSTSYLDWAVTSLFYSALHYIDAGLHEHRPRSHPSGIHPQSHEEHTPAVRSNFPSIYRSYRELKERSEDARYYLKAFTPEEVHGLEQRDFRAVRQFIRNRLKLPQR
jgi:hypothetical protein